MAAICRGTNSQTATFFCYHWLKSGCLVTWSSTVVVCWNAGFPKSFMQINEWNFEMRENGNNLMLNIVASWIAADLEKVLTVSIWQALSGEIRTDSVS